MTSPNYLVNLHRPSKGTMHPGFIVWVLNMIKLGIVQAPLRLAFLFICRVPGLLAGLDFFECWSGLKDTRDLCFWKLIVWESLSDETRHQFCIFPLQSSPYKDRIWTRHKATAWDGKGIAANQLWNDTMSKYAKVTWPVWLGYVGIREVHQARRFKLKHWTNSFRLTDWVFNLLVLALSQCQEICFKSVVPLPRKFDIEPCKTLAKIKSGGS